MSYYNYKSVPTMAFMPINRQLNIVEFLRNANNSNGQKRKVEGLKSSRQFVTSRYLLKYFQQFPEALHNPYKMQSNIANTIYISLLRSFGENIFINLSNIIQADMFVEKYFRILLDKKCNSIIELINLIPLNSDILFLRSQNLIKNVMIIISYEMQDRNVDFIQFHRAPFYSEIIHDFMFILAIGFIYASKFRIEQYSCVKNSIYTKKYIENGVNENELNILLDYENYFNLVNNYFLINNNSEFVFNNGVRCIEGPNFDCRKWGSGATPETKRRKEILHKVWGVNVKPRPARKSKSNSNSDSNIILIDNFSSTLLKNSKPMDLSIPLLVPNELYENNEHPTKKVANYETAEILLQMINS